MTSLVKRKARNAECFFSSKNTKESLSQGPLSCYSLRVINTTTAAITTATSTSTATVKPFFTNKGIFESYEGLLARRLEEIKDLNRSIKYYGLKDTAKSMNFMMDVLSQKIAETLEDIAQDILELDNHELEDSVELREQIETIASGELYNKADAM